MTVKELYEWAVKEGVENLNIIAVDRDIEDDDIQPRITKHTLKEFKDVELTYVEI